MSDEQNIREAYKKLVGLPWVDGGAVEALFAVAWKAGKTSVIISDQSIPNNVIQAARHFKDFGGHIGGLGSSRAANILWAYINNVLSNADINNKE